MQDFNRERDELIQCFHEAIRAAAQDDRYSPEYRAQQIEQARANARADLDNLRHQHFEKRVQRRAQLEETAQFGISASDLLEGLDAARLLYVRDMYLAGWKLIGTGAILEQWRDAIEADDRFAMRVFADYARFAILEKAPYKDQQNPTLPDGVFELQRETERAFLPAEAVQARDELILLEDEIAHIERQITSLESEIRIASVAPDGNVISAKQQASRELMI